MTNLEDRIMEQLAPIRVDSYVIDYANYASRKIVDFSGENLEIAFFLLSDPDDFKVNDIYLIPLQDVGKDYCHITPKSKLISTQHFEKIGKRLVGWAHSHAQRRPFHSEDDNNTTISFLKKYGVEQCIDLNQGNSVLESYTFDDDKSLRLSMIDSEGKKINCVLESDLFRHYDANFLRKARIQHRESKNVKLFTLLSMVFNKNSSPPAAYLGYEFTDSNTGIMSIPIEIYDSRRNINRAEIESTIVDNVINFQTNPEYVINMAKGQSTELGNACKDIRTLSQNLRKDDAVQNHYVIRNIGLSLEKFLSFTKEYDKLLFEQDSPTARKIQNSYNKHFQKAFDEVFDISVAYGLNHMPKERSLNTLSRLYQNLLAVSADVAFGGKHGNRRNL